MSLNKRKSLTALGKKRAKQLTLIPTNKELATTFNISTSAVSDILKKVIGGFLFIQNLPILTRKKRSLIYEEVDQALANWTVQATNTGLDITGDILKEKAINLLHFLKLTTLKYQKDG